MRKSKVYWTKVEEVQFMQEAARLRPEYKSLEAAAMKAMEILPPARRRAWASGLGVQISKYIKNRARQEAKAPAPAPVPVIAAQAPEPVIMRASETPAQDAVVGFAVDVIERVLTHPAVLAAAQTFIRAAFSKEATDAAIGAAWPESPAFANKPRVFILGVTDSEFEALERENADRLVLRYWNRNKSEHFMRSASAGAAKVIGLVPSIPSHLQQSLERRGVDYIRAYNIEGLKQAVSRIGAQ